MKKKPSLAIYIILALLFGGIGVHRMYEGKVGSGIAMFLLVWTGIPVIISLVDILTALTSRRELFE